MGRWAVPLALIIMASAVTGVPTFSRPAYNATIYENSRGKMVLKCAVKMGIQLDSKDVDEYEVRFKIVAGDKDKFFKAEERAVGDFVFLVIRTRTGNTHVLNRERKDRYALVVKANLTRRGSKTIEKETIVYVSVLDKNDLNPLFYPPIYEAVVTEDTKLHSSILKVNAEDADLGINGELYYYFKDKTEQFSIHPTTGVIILTRPLRYAEQSVHKLVVVAKDRGGGKPSYGNVTLHVKQVNLFGPEIYVHPLPSVIENAKTDVYAIVRVLDQDEGVHGQISSLEIVEGDPEGNFNVKQVKKDPKLGYEYHIELMNTLDREAAPRGYNLTLKAVDGGLPAKFTFKTLHVSIADTNDNEPVFEKNFYEVDVSENTPPNSPILRVKVNDADLGENGIVVFEIVTANADSPFTINPSTGMIYTSDWLDAEQTSFYTLTVAALDKAIVGPRKQSTTNVKVSVIDANDNDPTFEKSEVTVHVDENSSPGTSVTTVSAHDFDSGENSYISYSIANLKTVPFEIDHFSGIVKTTQVLDYESSRRNYVLKIRASDWGLPYRRQTEMQLKMIVRDVNDNRPQFEKTDCVGRVPKTAGIGSELLTLSAIDFDFGNIVTYRILSGNEDDCFLLDSTTGIIVVGCDLSGVKEAQREVNVTATDGVHFADSMTVVIKLIPMSNNLTADRINFKCKITGVAGRLTEIMALADKNNLNEEEFAMMPSRYGLNAHSPEFDNFPVQIVVNESMPIGSVIAAIRANDRDLGYNGEIIYGITSGDVDSVFRIDPITGDLRLVGFLDREREDEYFLNVTAYDLGRPKKSTSKYLPVTVLDVNDNPPKFEKTITSFRVTENAVSGTLIYSTNATDPDAGDNGSVVYSIVSDSSEFRIDPKTGDLTVAGVLDHEKRPFHEIIVRATDCAGTNSRDALFSDSIVKVFIDDVNDNPPSFSGDKFKVVIPEDLPIGAVIAIISAVDPDLGEGGQILYSLPDPTDVFEIDHLMGTVRLAKSLDYELSQGYSLTIQAQDVGVPSLSSTTLLTVIVADVNENEHPPAFADIVVKASVKEGLQPGTLVTTVTATDADPPGRDSTLFYRITSGNGLGYFSINDKGEIKTNLVLDAETESSYWLSVVCEDQGVIPLHADLQVYIEVEDVNDETPLTKLPFYSGTVMEETDRISEVVQLEAWDADLTATQIIYQITGGDPDGFFTMNETSGTIKTTGKKMDREERSEYTLEVTVRDSGQPILSSVTKVLVQVLDVNDHPPVFDQAVFHITVPELILPPSFMPQNDEGSEEAQTLEEIDGEWESFPSNYNDGVELFTMLAHDKDAGKNSRITYSLKGGKMGGKLFINSKTGVLYTQRSLLRGHQYNVMVMASDGGKPSKNATARISIKVKGIPSSSRHSPVIKNPNQSVQILESDSPGYMVAIIHASDLDDDTLYFNITDGNNDRVFMVTKDKGAVYLVKEVDAEKTQSYNLTLSVTDGVHTAYTQLFITVLDINEFHPAFPKYEYQLAVPESAETGSVILTLSATDEDIDKKLVYKIYNAKNPESLQLFTLKHNTGDVTIASTLDRETLVSHTITVVVHDSGTPTKKNFTRVIIKVEDVNDHMPQFNVDSLEPKIYRTSLVGTRIVTLMASDHDLMENGTVTYSIVSGNDGGKFSIDHILGHLCLAKTIGPSDPLEYSLVIQASDAGVRPLRNTLPVHISVISAADLITKFADTEVAAEVYENSPLGTLVTQLEAYGSGLLFEITNGNKESSFAINPTIGTITVNSELDREHTDLYNLTIAAFSLFGGKSTCYVTIYVLDANDNPPRFVNSQLEAWILESADVGSFILDKDGKPLVPRAIDHDLHTNSMFTYQFFTKNLSSMFHIDPNTGTVRTVVHLDYEKTPNIIITVIAIDKGLPKLTSETVASINLTIVNTNDSPPVFTRSSYNASVLLPTFDDVTVTQVSAVDADLERLDHGLTYVITEGNINGIYAIDEKTGLIRINDKSKLKGPSFHRLKITASDGKYSTETFVNIKCVQNYGDKGLSFEKKIYLGAVLENSTQSITVAVVSVRGALLNDHVIFSILNPQPQFIIGSVSGAVKTTGTPLDREVREFYSFVVQAERVTDNFKETPEWHIARTLVNVTVLDINDNCPIVINKELHAVISQSVRKHHFVTRVMAHDVDKEENGEVHFELENHNDIFKICPRSGNITIKQPVPSHIQEYKLVVAVRDNGIPPCTTTAVVHITVLDEDTPIFEQQFYQAYVPEDITGHAPIPLTLRTFSPLPNDIIYTIVEGDAYEEFQTVFTSGSATGTSPCVIRVNGALDYESIDTYSLKVRATDAVTGKYSDTVVEILVQDVNDNAPEFLQDIYNVSVLETLSIGGFVGQVYAIDRDVGLNGVVRYTIDTAMSEAHSWFYIKSSTGEVFLKKSLDFEVQPFYSLWINAFDTGTPSKSAYAKLWIHVIDVVDTGPVIVEPVVGLIYGTHASRGQFVAAIRSYHSVAGVKLSYSLLSHETIFSLDKDSGVLTIGNTGNITWDEVKVDFSVTDGVYTTSSTVLVKTQKANQMSPKFENHVYEITIKENVPKDAHVVTLRATDGDMGQSGHLKYSIISETVQGAFKINSSSGEISTMKLLDREAEKYYEFLVQAADPGGRSGLTTVLVTLKDVNDNTPTFIVPKYAITVSTQTTHNSTILQLEAVDLDDGLNGAITYSIVGNGKIENLFSIDPNFGNLTLKGQTTLSKDSVYQFFVRAKDGGNPSLSSDVPVTVYVSSASEKVLQPIELPNSFFLSESSEKGSTITLLDNSFDGKMSYKVFGATKSIINVSKSGKVTLAKTLDREEVSVHKLAILMEITTNPPISSVAHLRIHVLDVNDNKPKFERANYHLLVMEGIPEGEKLLKVKAYDSDEGKNAEVHYWLEDNLGILSIDRRTGWITAHAELDREEKTEYILNVVAFDNGTPALSDKATIHIKLLDANDNPPVFVQTSWNISISEDSPVGKFLLQLETTDADEKSERLEFYIMSGDKDCKFNLNNQGKMLLMRNLDREETSQYFLAVTASDGKFTSQTSIFIRILDINDEKPQCLKETYFVQLSEDVPLFTYVTSVEAFDPDSEPNFYFSLNSGDDKYFSINNVTGEIRTKALLDREQTSEHSIIVYVSDKENSTWRCQSTVHIKLVDVNDCPPKFDMNNMTAMVVENAPIGSVVTMVHATDPDLALSAKVKYSLLDSVNGKFKIDSKSGLVRLMGTVDREEKDTYGLVVRASDETAPELFSDAKLTVTVLDVNDNPPIFSQKVYHSQVSESAPVLSHFMKLEAYSADIGANAEIFYLIINGDPDNQFYLDLNTGIMSVAKPLDYETTKNFMLTVEARDLGEPPLSTQALVNISVIDSNDNTPVFLQRLYTTVVPEDVGVGNTIIQVIASDADSGKNGRITYSIERGDLHDQFSIDPNNGFVNVVAHLDREQKDSYKLLIRASDGGTPPLFTTASIIIEVSDVNDNPPRFYSSNYSAFVQEGKNAGWSIIKLEVDDADLKENGGPFEFDIQSGNENNLFSISADGVIKTNAFISGYLHKSYNLQVRVYDSGTPPLYSDTVVNVMVTEESLHPPLITPLNVVVMLYENHSPKKNFLGSIHVSDSDPYDTHAFSIETTEPNKFVIDPMNGRLSMIDTDPGLYRLNVSVTDGKFTSNALITVVVQSVFRNMLLSSFSLRFRGTSPKYFLVNGWKTILRVLKKLLKTDILLLSMQPSNRDLDVLLTFQEYISMEELDKVITDSRLAVVQLKCNCQNGGKCKQNVTIVPHQMLTTSTETESFVAPEHTHVLFCSCSPAYSGEYCEEDACECPPPTLCSHQGGTMVCTSPPPVAPLCSDNRTCDSPSASEYTFVYPYIVILLISAVLLSAVTAISVILWQRNKDRNRNAERPREKKVMFRVDSQMSNMKISNIKASQVHRPSSFNNGSEVLFNSLPLNNLENSRNCSLEEGSSFSCSYLQNIDPTKKITNVENSDSLESPKQVYEMTSYGFPPPNEGLVMTQLEDH